MKNKMTFLLAMSLFAGPMMAQTDPVRTDSGSHHSPAWIVALSGIELMEQRKGGAEVVKRLPADSRTIVMAGNPLPDSMNEEQRGESVLSLEKCKTALDKPSNAGLRTILVDLEHWSGTPLSDQKNPETATNWRARMTTPYFDDRRARDRLDVRHRSGV